MTKRRLYTHPSQRLVFLQTYAHWPHKCQQTVSECHGGHPEGCYVSHLRHCELLKFGGGTHNTVIQTQTKWQPESSHETLEVRFHDFSMTFHEQISNFPWPFPRSRFSLFSMRNSLLDNFKHRHVCDYIQNNINGGKVGNISWPFPQSGFLQIFHAKFITGQFWQLPYLWLYFERG